MRENYIYGSTDIGVRFPINNKFQLGADLGVDSLQLDGQKGGKVFAVGVIDTPYGTFSIGTPRLVMPQVFDVPGLGGSEVLDVVQGLSTGEFLRFMTFFPPPQA